MQVGLVLLRVLELDVDEREGVFMPSSHNKRRQTALSRALGACSSGNLFKGTGSRLRNSAFKKICSNAGKALDNMGIGREVDVRGEKNCLVIAFPNTIGLRISLASRSSAQISAFFMAEPYKAFRDSNENPCDTIFITPDSTEFEVIFMMVKDQTPPFPPISFEGIT